MVCAGVNENDELGIVVPPKFKVVTVDKFSPVRVTTAPTGPEVGERPVRVGQGYMTEVGANGTFTDQGVRA